MQILLSSQEMLWWQDNIVHQFLAFESICQQKRRTLRSCGFGFLPLLQPHELGQAKSKRVNEHGEHRAMCSTNKSRRLN